MRHFRIWVAAALCLIPVTHADTRACLCDIAQPATLEVRECSLCREAEKQPSGIPYFFLKDASPNKPNRWLALPRFHGNNPQELQEMTPGQRAAYWKAAIDKAREVWGENWGIALNSTDRRTQCHIHLHIGKLLPDSEDDRFVVADGPEGIPLPESGNGIWVHPVGGKYHAHVNVPAGELKLQK